MITIHHLGVSQSDRVVWLMEELGLPYELKWYNRKENGLAPEEFLALHPAATAPVITDGDKVLTESAAIVEYICHRYAGGKLTIAPNQPDYFDYLYWMQFNNNVIGLFFGRMGLRAGAHGEEADRVTGLIERREKGYYDYMDQHLAKKPFRAGSELTCADIMAMFPLTAMPLFGGPTIDHLPNVKAYVERVSARPAYIKAMKIAGPAAPPR